MLRRQKVSIFLILFGLINAVTGILSNVAASTIPEPWKPYLWLSWPLFGLFTFIGITFGIWQEMFSDKGVSEIDLIQQQRNRKAMLNQVYNTWIEGLLKKSLYNEVVINLRMETRPDVVQRPWNVVIQLLDKEPKVLPSGKKMLEVFEETSEALLILGEPGSGKTTAMLELTQQAIEVAETDNSRHIPVVFNLSSWKPKQTIADWLILELQDKYSVPRKLSQQWVDNDELMLLLDGLDEVRSGDRERCAQAINAFLEDHRVPLAVCSRKQEYEELATRLRLKSAILIQPLDPEQVNWYLMKASSELKAAYQVLKNDVSLRDFIQTPLALNILMLAYQDSTVEDTNRLVNANDRRKHLFDTYIRSMFERRGINSLYTPEETKHWLKKLSKVMTDIGQSSFYIERIEEGWIRNLDRRKRLDTLARILIGLFVGLLTGVFIGVFFGVFLGAFTGVLFGLITAVFTGLYFGLLFRLLCGLEDRQMSLLLGRRFSRLINPSPELLKPSDKITWSWVTFRSKFHLVLIAGLAYGLAAGLLTGLLGGLFTGLLGGLFTGLLFGLLIGLLYGLNSTEVVNRSQPAQGIRSSWKNAFLYGSFFGLFYALLIGLLIGLLFLVKMGLFYGLFYGLFFGLLSGLFFGVICGMIFGGMFLFTHYFYRWFLFLAKDIPWNLVAFLDYATERIFMRKVGGGYIFIHRMLMEHFVEMDVGLSEAVDVGEEESLSRLPQQQ